MGVISVRRGIRTGSRGLLPLVIGVVLSAILGSAGAALVAPFAPPTSSPTLLGHEHVVTPPRAFPLLHVHPIHLSTPATVDPTGYYSSEPAPMGIGDFGVGADGNPYEYNTTEFLGNFSWQSLNFDEDGTTTFTNQLNVVLQFVQDGVTYAYWIQDVAFMDSASGDLTFENNIWNFTSTCMDNTAVEGNGTVYPYSGCQGYYAEGATTQPGASLTMPSPGDFALLVRSYETASGQPEVAFEYWDGVTSYYVTYDNVIWPWATGLSADNNFLVDGYSYNPLNLFYDAELTIGGPGGGAATEAQDLTHITSRLLYWNGNNFEAPPSVWNFGSNTAEAVSNIQSIFSHDGAGLPLTLQLNGTTRNATPAQAYNQNLVGQLAISATGFSGGTVAIPGDVWSFDGDAATLTLVPGTYPVWVNSSSETNYLGACGVVAGSTTSVTVTGGCGPELSTPSPSSRAADVGQSVTFESTLLSPGSGGDTYVWHTSPSGLGCSSSTTLTLSCTPTSVGTYSVNVTVTDSDGRSSTSGTELFTVSSDPTVSTPSPSSTKVETGASVTFSVTASGGATPYSYAWNDLPSPCSGTDTASPVCTPATAGVYSISVTLTDANGYSVTSSVLSFPVLSGPSVATPSSSPEGSVDLGQTVIFTANATGGSGSYRYTWSGLPTGCSAASSATVTCTPTATGLYSVSVTVVDSLGGTATSTPLVFAVYTDPTIGSLTVSPGTIDIGQTFQFALSAPSTGGAGSYRYVWSGLPVGCVSNDSTQLACTPIKEGSGTAEVTVYDANNVTNASTVSWWVYTDPYLAGISADPRGIDLGQEVTFASIGLAGGTGVFSYRWTGLPAGCVGGNRSTIECTPTTVGSENVTLNVTDTNGRSVSRTAMFTVLADPTVGTPTASPGSVSVGRTVTFSVNVSGGLPSYRYNWSGLPAGCASVDAPSVTCTPSGSGTTEVSVTITDSNGFNVTSAALPYTVSSAPSGGLSIPVFEGWAVVAEAAAVAAIVLVVVLARRARKRGNRPPP